MVNEKGEGFIAIIECAEPIRKADEPIRCDTIRLRINRIADSEDRHGDDTRF
jgi:hypothetical protein